MEHVWQSVLVRAPLHAAALSKAFHTARRSFSAGDLGGAGAWKSIEAGGWWLVVLVAIRRSCDVQPLSDAGADVVGIAF